MSLKEIFLEGNPPWGFRMNGGADAGHPLRISRVNPGSKAEAKGVREGDLISSINGQSTKCLTNSESHALLRTVKENLLLGLNEDKNASPRRRSREIKSASIISQEKERSESPAQTKGNKNPSANQKRHQRRTRLRHRIKEMLGIKSKDKRESYDEDWVIVDSSLKVETKSLSNSLTDEEKSYSFVRASSEPVVNNSEEVYDNFEFKTNKESINDEKNKSHGSNISSVKTIECCKCINGENNYKVQKASFEEPLSGVIELPYSKTINHDYRNQMYAHQHAIIDNNEKFESELNVPNSSKKVTLPEDQPSVETVQQTSEKSAIEVHLPEGEELSETLNFLPATEMVEVCNATIMIEDEKLSLNPENPSNPVISLQDNEQLKLTQASNPDYEPVEVNSSVIIYPSYSSTLSYYFPQRRFLEAIVEENSDISENNDEKQEKPWENSQLIREANNIDSIPNDWYGSEEGIDTSWRDGKSIEEVSDVPVLSDSHSDSDLLPEDIKLIKHNENSRQEISEIKTHDKENETSKKGSNRKIEVVLGKPPINVVNTYRISGKQTNKPSTCKTEIQLQPKPIKPLKETDLENDCQKFRSSDSCGNKVTCRLMNQNEISDTKKSDDVSTEGDKDVKYIKKSLTTKVLVHVPKEQPRENQQPPKCDAEKVSCKIVDQKDMNISSDDFPPLHINVTSNQRSFQSEAPRSEGKSNFCPESNDKKYMKTIPSSAVLKNVVSSYYNTTSVPRKVDLSDKFDNVVKDKSSVEVCTTVIKPGAEKDVELIYIDSSDSEAFLSASNRTSLSFEKEEDDLVEPIVTDKVFNACIDAKNSGHIIKEEITNINQSVKEISDICCDAPKEKKSRASFKLNSKMNEDIHLSSILPNLLSPIMARKCLPSRQKVSRRRFSYPFSEHDLCKNYTNAVTCCHLDKHIDSEKPDEKNSSVLKEVPLNISNLPSKTIAIAKSGRSEGGHQLLVRKHSLSSCQEEAKSTESVFFDFSDGSISSESYTLPDVTHDNELLSDVSTDTIKYIGIPSSSPKSVPWSPVEVSDIVDLHKKFVERRGYHEASPIIKRKQGSQKTPEPDLIALSKCQERSEQAYTPELLAEAANLLALHNYHESRQKKMRHENTTKSGEALIRLQDSPCITKQCCSPVVESKQEINMSHSNEYVDIAGQIELNEKTKEDNTVNKSLSTENETVGKSRLLELFQKLELKSSNSECTRVEPFPYWLLLGDDLISDDEEVLKKTKVPCDINNHKTLSTDKREDTSTQKLGINVCKPEVSDKCERHITSPDARPISLPTGEIFQRKMYEEYLGKIAELAERRSSKIIKISNISQSTNPSSENQPFESEFMNKLKERNEKLGISTSDNDECDEKIDECTKVQQNLPKHLKELMEITEECGGVWSPAQTPEAERKKFDFSSEIKEEKEREKKEEEEKKEPQPPVWTPRSAGPSPTLERKFRTVNFQSPPPTRKEIKTPNETPELPQELPEEGDKENKSRLTSSSSENSTLSSSLRLPAAQNPTITLLQKAREGHIPRGAQYLEQQPIIGPNEIIYSVKKEHVSEDQTKKIVDLGPRKIEGIGPTTRDGIPTVLRSEVKEDNQQRWYKRMYDSLHKADYDKDFVTVKYKTKRKGQYPYTYAGGYASEPERLGYDSDASVSKYATLDRRKIRNKENDFTTSTMPRNRYAPGVKYAVNVYKNQPGRIEDYEPGHSSIAEKETKQWWDEVMDIFDGELNDNSRHNHLSSKTSGKPFTYSLKDAGYESDSTLIFKRRENNMSGQMLSPSDQKMAYKVIQKGGEVPLQGLRKAAPERPKEPLGNPIPTPPRDSTSRQRIQESPHRYVESEVNIHYRSPVRREAKVAWPEDELAQRQAEIMRRIYQEQKRTKYLNELHDMYSRRHADNLLPSQKSPIPLNRYDDFPVEVQPPRPRDRTPEPKLVARALYNFVGQTSRELSFRRGDIIYVRRQIDKNWYEGEHNAMVGLFPFNYVEIIPYDGIRTLPKKANEGQARAKFNFQAQTHLELSLVKGELVLLTRRVDENWFEGRIGNRKGIFPVSYVEVLVEPGERAASPSSGSGPTKPIVAPASHSVMLNGAKDLGQQHYQPPRPAIYASSSLPPSNKINDISLVNQTLHIDTQSDPVPYRVMYNYRPQNEDELELKEGDIVYVMEKCDDGWYVGSLHKNGQFGTFPGNYVERIQ